MCLNGFGAGTGFAILFNSFQESVFEMEQILNCVIVGSGPAGYTAAIYASRAGLQPLVYEGLEAGGQLLTTTIVENFPGFPEGVDASVLMSGMKAQAERFGAVLQSGVISEVDFSGPIHVLKDDSGRVIRTKTVIIATGASARYLGLPSESKYKGMGVSACATCDGFFYRGRDVAVVGGGDTACEEAVYLSNICRKVYMIVRRDVLRASKAMQDKLAGRHNIEMLWNCNTQEVLGDGAGVTGARLIRKDGKVFEISVDGFFVAIGHHPNAEVFSKYIQTDEDGYIVAEPGSSRTYVAGVFAAGDVRDRTYRQAVTAAASGCQAALDAERYLAEFGTSL